MKNWILIIMLSLSGCATQMDTQTVNLLNQRLHDLENGRIPPKNAIEASPRALNASTNEVIEQPPHNTGSGRLNDAQRDFVQFILNYLADEE